MEHMIRGKNYADVPVIWAILKNGTGYRKALSIQEHYMDSLIVCEQPVLTSCKWAVMQSNDYQ